MQAAISDKYGVFAQFLPNASQEASVNEVSQRDANANPFRVLIVEPSVPLARLLANGLLNDCSSVEVSHDLASGLKQFDKLKSELLILDLDMPDVDGPALLRRLRAQRPEVRVLALSGRDGVEDMVTALDNGADDYLSKPFSLLELMARVRVLRRRSQTIDRVAAPKSTNLVLHRDQCRVERDGRLIDLTPREFTLLEYLMQNAGKTLSRPVLTQEVWNMSAGGNTNIVDVYIKYLRDKIDGDHDVKLIRTVRGMGYSYHAEA
jgi:DNA-binding response OmpR family regulator